MERSLLFQLTFFLLFSGISFAQSGESSISLPSRNLVPAFGKQAVTIDGLFYETAQGRTALPKALVAQAKSSGRVTASTKMPDGRTISLSVVPEANNFNI